ncbi:MAG TPA: hypothetical protein PKE40_04020 [Arachnia sp.]|nr:hypothetical protein [Arachnia sp.]HMT85498.1 hypothetical protein [Arachnia sp.]
MQIDYSLAETLITLQARAVTVVDPYVEDGRPRRTIEDLQIGLVQAADPEAALTLEIDRGDRELSATLTPDGRLQSVAYNSVGTGTKVVAGAGRIIGFIGSLLASAVGGGRKAGQTVPARRDLNAPDTGQAKDPDEDWHAKFAKEAELRDEYTATHDKAATALHQIRDDMLTEKRVAALRELRLRAEIVERVLAQALQEVARIDSLKAAWRESLRSRSSSDLRSVYHLTGIPERSEPDLDPPAIPFDGDAGYALYRDFRLIVEQRSSVSEGSGITSDDVHSELSGWVYWRLPREVEIWVWKVSGEDDPQLVSREQVWVSDGKCLLGAMEFTSSWFGEHGGEVTFNDDGRPGAIRHAQQSGAGAFFDALTGATDAVAAGVKTAKETAEGFWSLADIQAERDKAKAARDLEIAKNTLELKGVRATEQDYEELQRAEQAVKLKAAQESLAPAQAPGPLALITQELELAQARNELAAEKRRAELDVSLAELRAELARLELQQQVDRVRPHAD